MSGLPQPEPGLLAARAWQVFEHVPRPLDPLLQLGRRWVLPLARYSLPVTLCRGRTPSGEDTSLISIGRGYQHDHVRRQVFDSGPGQESLDPVPLHRVHARLRQALDEVDLVAALVPRAIAKMLAGHDFLHLPGLLDFLLPTDDHAFKLASHTIRTDVRRVRQSGLKVRLTHDLQEFDRFYDRFHSPMVERRFGASGILQPRPVLRRRFRFGGLLWIERQGRSIAGDVFETSNGSFNVLVHGEHAGLDPAETGLANRAAYVYGTEHARRLGCHVVNLGGSLPSLTNGVVRHKCAWGARITPRHETHVALLVGWKRPHPGVLRFLARHVPVIFDGSHLAAVTALEDPGTGGPRQAGRLLRKLAARGLGPLIVVSQNGWIAPERGDVLPGKDRLRLIDAGSSAAVLAALSAG